MILVTGGTGLVGSHLLFDLVKSGEKVRALKRSTSDLSNVKKVFSYYSNDYENLFSEIEWVEGDILDIFSLKDSLEGVDKIYHSAAVVSFNPEEKNNLLKTNIEGTANVVNVALDCSVKKLCYVSSIATLGREKNEGVTTEDSNWQNSKKNSIYSISKYGGEREVWRGTEEGLDAVIINPSVIIGPGDWTKGSIKILELVWKGLRFYTKGVNGYVDVRDVSKSMIQLMNGQIKNERFIVSSANCTYHEVFTKIAKFLNKKEPSIHAKVFLSQIAWRVEKVKGFITNRPPAITKETARTANQHYHYSSEKIKKALDFEFITIDQTLKDVCEIFLKDK